jgi:4-amino-4-deoxy-L-arabinose transferase-like glycosyltransferase
MPTRRTAWLLLGVAAACYVAGYLLYPPRTLTISDETAYVGQAVAFAKGRTTVPAGLPFSRAVTTVVPSLYPPGTSLLQTPFVRLGGWQAAPWASVLSLIAATLLLALWLEGEGFSPLFALLFLVYVPALVLGRTGMSDVPSAAISVAGLLLFWRGQERRWPWWLGSGLLAGLSLGFRSTNALLFVPLFAGTLLRRERKAVALVVGGLLGLGVRLLVAVALFGSAGFGSGYDLAAGYGWGLDAAWRNAPVYALALLVLIPGGLLAALLYRGRRRAELAATGLLVALFFLFYRYSGVESGGLKRLVLGPRYFIPLAPLLVFALAEVATRRWAGSALAARWGGLLAAVCSLGVALTAFAVHPALADWSKSQSSLVRAIYDSTPDGAALVLDPPTTNKFVSPVYGERVVASWWDVPAHRVPEVLRAHPATYLILLDRSDSDYFRNESLAGAKYLSEVEGRCRLTLVHDAQHDSVDRLRIWRVDGCD